MIANISKEDLHPILTEEAEDLYRGQMIKLMRAAYLRSFTPHEERKCVHKFPHFATWWKTLNDRQKERVRGVLAAEVLHMYRE